MSPNEKGAFCQKCATQVYDFTQKSTLEIKQTLRSMLGQPVCGRITQSQEDLLNAEFEAWTNHNSRQSLQSILLFSMLAVFGLALFSCEHEQDKEKIFRVQSSAMEILLETEKQPAEAPLTNLPDMKPSELLEKDILLGKIECEIPDVKRTHASLYADPMIVKTGEMHYGGAMISTSSYDKYLIETVTADPVVEYDLNGEPFPVDFKAIAYPNPAADYSTLQLSVPAKNQFEIGLYDMSGKLIRPLYSGEIARGTFRQEFGLSDLNSGVYLILINSADFRRTVRIVKP